MLNKLSIIKKYTEHQPEGVSNPKITTMTTAYSFLQFLQTKTGAVP
jgi:hypothetical protein